MPSVVGHVYGPSRLPTALAMRVWGAGYIMVRQWHISTAHVLTSLQGAPIAGYILEHYGGAEAGRAAFRPAMYYAGSMSLGSAVFTVGLRRLMSKKLLVFA
ncbi:hypothetical protein FIBSPDRAFT_113220 [Athelia psychrophila]|uniref:Uncharacterized protein n=1 Tax=Athelia psychrophila TaxID=1759441 RepID=A0A166TI90_9AGAM|nr:hypothetical protein FIBSPDRAFT_113220 [Fibularhizoctonia sp. CBS 109695]